MWSTLIIDVGLVHIAQWCSKYAELQSDIEVHMLQTFCSKGWNIDNTLNTTSTLLTGILWKSRPLLYILFQLHWDGKFDSVVADLPCHLNLDSDTRELIQTIQPGSLRSHAKWYHLIHKLLSSPRDHIAHITL